MNNEMMDITLKYISDTDINIRKKMGQYFTPSCIKDVLMDLLPKKDNALILEPSCGTGEFLKSIKENFKNPIIHAIELDKKLYDIAKENFKDTKIYNCDTLSYKTDIKYDYIIGNPPYFEFLPEDNIKNEFKNVINGRTNIYSLFIKKGIDLLKDGGYLAYVIPTSLNNGAYFSKLRNFIINHADIEHIIKFDEKKFSGAQQAVMVFIIKKTQNTGRYIFSKKNITIFSKDYKNLAEAFNNKKSLNELGFKVKTGSIVWNQNKQKLSNDKKHTILIWAHNIDDNKINLNIKNKKHQYININKSENINAIVVNRIIGTGDNAKLKAAIISKKHKWLAENHVNVIYNKSSSLKILKKIHFQLISNDTLKIIKYISGNTQLSKNELENLIPIDEELF